MHPQLVNLIARERRAELASRAARARLANEARSAGPASSPRRHVRRLVASRWTKARHPTATAPAQPPRRCKGSEMRRMTTHAPARAFAAAAENLTVADGTRISFRQLGAADRAALADLFARLTPESRHKRFLYPKCVLTAHELTFFADIDHVNHEAIAAVDQRDGAIVGVARYVLDAKRAGVAEVAIEVADAFQAMGIGAALASLTIERAQTNGVRLLTARTLWDNHAARRLLRRLRFQARQSHGSEIDYDLKLDELAAACIDGTAMAAGIGVRIAGLEASFPVIKMPPHNTRYRGARSEQ